jgi:hypothetical protein
MIFFFEEKKRINKMRNTIYFNIFKESKMNPYYNYPSPAFPGQQPQQAQSFGGPQGQQQYTYGPPDPISYFQRAAGIDGKLGRQEFALVMTQLHPDYRNSPDFNIIVDSVFNQIDTNRNGYIDQNEFLQAYNMLRNRLGITVVHHY